MAKTHTNQQRLTPAVHRKIIFYLKLGNYLETAAAAVNISSRSVRYWLRRGVQGEEPFATFAIDVEWAIAQSEVLDVEKLAAVARRGDMKALAWRLERRYRGRWGAKLVLVTEAREEAVGEILERLRKTLDEELYQVVLLALSDPESGEETTDDSDTAGQQLH